MIAFSVSSWSSLGRRWVWLRVLTFSLALLLLPRIAPLFKSGLILDRHHMATASTFLDISLCSFKHATQFIQALFRPMHMVVRDEVPIARWKRRENEISSQLWANWEAQLLQPLLAWFQQKPLRH